MKNFARSAVFSVNFQLSKAASLSGIGVTASFWSAVERVRISLLLVHRADSRENSNNFFIAS